MVASGEQITMRSAWVSNRGESPPQTKVTLQQILDLPSRGRRTAGQTGQRQEAGTRGGGGRGGEAGGGGRGWKQEEGEDSEEGEEAHIKSRTFTRGEEKRASFLTRRFRFEFSRCRSSEHSK